MLQVQVEYLKHLEQKRHDLAQEDIGYKTVFETVRHNQVAEDQNQQNINESIQHNRATEAIGYMQANAALKNAETNRMLANAQIPLIEAQTAQAKTNARLAYWKGTSEKTMSKFNQLKYGVSDSSLKDASDFGTGFAVAQFINEIIPF